MKIGIITVHRAHNCGAMLQALALQEALRRLGHAPCLVEANTIGENTRMPHTHFTSWKCVVAYVLEWFFSIGIRSRKMNLFRNFLRHLERSQIYASVSEIKESDYDLFIVGSDQVWNLNIVKDSNLFLLTFCKTKEKKCAYAASFGLEELPSSWLGLFKENLVEFASIAVREERAAEIVEDLIGEKPPVVLDPTLLLQVDDYRPYEAERIVSKPYVCVYSIGAASAYMRRLGKEIARARNLKVVFVNATSFGDWTRCLTEYQLISPDRFLSFLKYAECVVCTSYHATIFSIHYKRPFLTVLAKGSKVTSRPKSLLRRLGLESHLVEEGAELADVQALAGADFDQVHARIRELRGESLLHLERMTGIGS